MLGMHTDMPLASSMLSLTSPSQKPGGTYPSHGGYLDRLFELKWKTGIQGCSQILSIPTFHLQAESPGALGICTPGVGLTDSILSDTRCTRAAQPGGGMRGWWEGDKIPSFHWSLSSKEFIYWRSSSS